MSTLWRLESVSVDSMFFGVSQCRPYGPWGHVGSMLGFVGSANVNSMTFGTPPFRCYGVWGQPRSTWSLLGLFSSVLRLFLDDLQTMTMSKYHHFKEPCNASQKLVALRLSVPRLFLSDLQTMTISRYSHIRVTRKCQPQAVRCQAVCSTAVSTRFTNHDYIFKYTHIREPQTPAQRCLLSGCPV